MFHVSQGEQTLIEAWAAQLIKVATGIRSAGAFALSQRGTNVCGDYEMPLENQSV